MYQILHTRVLNKISLEFFMNPNCGIATPTLSGLSQWWIIIWQYLWPTPVRALFHVLLGIDLFQPY